MNSTKLIFFLSTFALIFVLWNQYDILLRVQEGYAYRKASVSEVYNMEEEPHIKSINDVDKDRVVFELSSNAIITKKSIDIPFNGSPYTDSIKFDFEGINIELKYQRQSRDRIHIISSSIPISDDIHYEFNDFCSIDFLPTFEVESIKQELNNWQIDTIDGTVNKLTALALNLTSSLRNDGNVVIYNPANATPFKLYVEGVQGNSRITCGEFEHILFAFANLAGIKTRRVGLVGKYPSKGMAKVTGHHFNEIYLPKSRTWAYCDLSTDKLLFINDKGEYMNTYDLYNSYIANTYANIRYYSTRGDTLSLVSLKGNDQNESYYFSPHSIMLFKRAGQRYSLSSKIKRYLFLSDPALGDFDSNMYLVRYGFNILSLLLTFIIMMSLGVLLKNYFAIKTN